MRSLTCCHTCTLPSWQPRCPAMTAPRSSAGDGDHAKHACMNDYTVTNARRDTLSPSASSSRVCTPFSAFHTRFAEISVACAPHNDDFRIVGVEPTSCVLPTTRQYIHGSVYRYMHTTVPTDTFRRDEGLVYSSAVATLVGAYINCLAMGVIIFTIYALALIGLISPTMLDYAALVPCIATLFSTMSSTSTMTWLVTPGRGTTHLIVRKALNHVTATSQETRQRCKTTLQPPRIARPRSSC